MPGSSCWLKPMPGVGSMIKAICFILTMAMIIATNSLAQNIPANSRSRAAVKQATPLLSPRLNIKNLELGQPVFIRIFKEEAELEIWLEKEGQFQLFHTWPIAAFSGSLGPKTRQGDYQAPEGFYFVPPGMMNPSSSFHLSFNLGYPNRYDRSHGYTGSALMVHGSNCSIGCYAMTDPVIEEIWTLINAAFSEGQPYFRVHSFPFRMTPENMARHENEQWEDFWKNLQEGYNYFETHGTPPNVEVRNRRYVFD
jgi:murein L,D-transpeptidase YafK